MKKTKSTLAIIALSLSCLIASPLSIANNDLSKSAKNDLTKMYDKGTDLLQGDQRLACEAILCLSQGYSSGECRKSIKKYYSFRHKKAWKVAQWRRSFLNLCPKDNGKVDKEKLSKIGLDFSKD